jgi:hypothetical protein
MPKDGTRIHFEWQRPRSGEVLRVTCEYHADADGWEVIGAMDADEHKALVLTPSDRAELDYVAGDEYRAGLESERVDVAYDRLREEG